MRDPEVVEGPTRPICPPSDPISCLPRPRDVVPGPFPYQDATHRTHIRLTSHSESLGNSRFSFCACGCFSQGSPGRRPAGGGGIGFYARRCVRDAASSRLGRFVVVFCCRIGGAAAGSRCEATALLLLPRRFLFHFPSSCYVVIIAHAHAARRDVTRWAVTTAIETVAVIATGGRPIARRAATSGGVVAAPRDAAQLRETEVAAGWRPRRGGVVTPRRVLLWR